MIYYFTWNSHILIEETLKSWKNKFISQFWDFNFIEIKDLEELDNNYLIETLTWWSFLSEKKLIIIRINQTKNESEKLEFLISLKDKIPENNILLLYEIYPDKKSKHFKFFKENSNFKEFNINIKDLPNIISNKYKDKISSEAINKIILYKANNLSKIYSEIDKLLITKEKISSKDIEENIIPELEESIFQIIDALTDLNKNILLEKINILLNYINIYAFYNNFLANIRTNLYILKYKDLQIKWNDIENKLNLWNRWFIVNKKQKISFNKLKEFYIWLIDLDKKLKTWKLFRNDDEVFKLEIEKLILKI